MAVVHFTTIPCEPDTANRHVESNISGKICPCTNNNTHARFEDFRIFLCVFISDFGVFVSRLPPNRSLVAWGAQENALGA